MRAVFTRAPVLEGRAIISVRESVKREAAQSIRSPAGGAFHYAIIVAASIHGLRVRSVHVCFIACVTPCLIELPSECVLQFARPIKLLAFA